jgi:uncharacterized protein (DUF3084 family)
MIHTRRQIIENQEKFQKEIEEWLKKEFLYARKELARIESRSQKIRDAQESLSKKMKRASVSKGIKSLFISEKNLYPKFYAWWDEECQEAVRFKYEDL